MTEQSTSRGAAFSVMTVNVRFGLADTGRFAWENRKPAFTELFGHWQPDFIAMQEVNNFQADFFRTCLKGYECIGERSPAPSFWQNVLIFYKTKWRCQSHERFFLSNTPAVPSRMPESKWPRQAVVGRFEKDGTQVVCLNTHFDFSEYVQKKSAGIVLEHLERYSAENTPEIISGDFNAAPAGACHRLLTDTIWLAAPFSDAFGNDAPGTFHNFTGRPVGDRVDWILWRKNARLTDKKIITDRFAGTYPSDHFPVYAAFAAEL